jgi:hypothetical protein
MSIKGKVLEIGTTETFGAKGFRKRNLIIETDEKYSQEICIEFVQDNTDLLNSFQIDDRVTIEYNVRGRKWESPQGEIKYFTSIQGWKIEESVEEVKTEQHSPDRNDEGTEDDLPF